MPQKIFNTCDVDVTIIPQSVSVNRGLYHLMRSHQLTECLDWIEKNLGFTGDAAIFVLSPVNQGVL